MMLSLDKTKWPNAYPTLEDKSTCTHAERKLPTGRKLPAIPRDQAVELHIATSPESEDSSIRYKLYVHFTDTLRTLYGL